MRKVRRALLQVPHPQLQVIPLGDVSMRNLLWTVEPEPNVFLLDCDSMRLAGDSPAVPAAETVDWDDPALGTKTPNLSSDRYKLAMIVQRVLLVESQARPHDPALQIRTVQDTPPTVWSL